MELVLVKAAAPLAVKLASATIGALLAAKLGGSVAAKGTAGKIMVTLKLFGPSALTFICRAIKVAVKWQKDGEIDFEDAFGLVLSALTMADLIPGLDKCLHHLLPHLVQHTLKETLVNLKPSLEDLRTLWKYYCLIRKIMNKEATLKDCLEAASELKIAKGALFEILQNIGNITHWYAFDQDQLIKEIQSKIGGKFGDLHDLQQLAETFVNNIQTVTDNTLKGFEILEKWFPETGFSEMGHVLLKQEDLKHDENLSETALKEWIFEEINGNRSNERKFGQEDKTNKDIIAIGTQIVFEFPDEIFEDCIADLEPLTFSRNMVDRLLLQYELEGVVSVVERLGHNNNKPAVHLTLKNCCLDQCHVCHQLCGKVWRHNSQHYCSTSSPCKKHPIHKDHKVGARGSTVLIGGLIALTAKEVLVKTLTPKEALCPWCDQMTWHVPYTANFLGRNLFMCDCAEKTLTCVAPGCSNMAKSWFGYDANFCPKCF